MLTSVVLSNFCLQLNSKNAHINHTPGLRINIPRLRPNRETFQRYLKFNKITLYLEGLDEGTNADAIVGAYKYENRKGYLLLNGYRNADGNIILVEQDTPNFSGIFFGSLSENHISGTWTSANQKFSYPFKIRALTAKDSELHQFQAAIAAKAQ